MIVLKILAAPVMVALSLLAAMVTFLFCVASAVCEMGCIVLTLLSLILFIGGQTGNLSTERCSMRWSIPRVPKVCLTDSNLPLSVRKRF